LQNFKTAREDSKGDFPMQNRLIIAVMLTGMFQLIFSLSEPAASKAIGQVTSSGFGSLKPIDIALSLNK
jgi:hypothetical protein